MSLNNYCKLKNIHFIGIGGIGMSAIAEVMFHSGYIISGSDQASNSITTKLSSIGITVNIGHAASHVSGADIVVFSSAIGQDNIEFSTAKSLQIPIFSRAEMLAELMRSKFSIAIAGTHGKTTTSSLIAHIFKQAKLKPGYIIGGILGNTNTNAEYGDSDFLITEADESDGSFTLLKPMLAAITNIDNDHMEAYSHNENSLQQSFLQFIHNLPFYGSIVICGDDPGINSIRDKIYRPIVSYGLQSGNMITASDIKHSGTRSNFIVSIQGSDTFAVQLNMPGKHNILNTLAAIAIADICQIPHAVIAQAIQSFSGVGRRFEKLGDHCFDGNKVTVIDDYGHHPKEINVTIAAAREAYLGRRLVMVFEPHRYSRTKELWQDFITALSLADLVIVTDIYAASEVAIAGIDSASLVSSLQKHSTTKALYCSQENLLALLQQQLRQEDVLIFQGAGSISKNCRQLLANLPVDEYAS